MGITDSCNVEISGIGRYYLRCGTIPPEVPTEIPNGGAVPDPCSTGGIWGAVGHYNPAGSRIKNPFARDFVAQGHKWTTVLCGMDSDGDGIKNGEELGDPLCEWAPGQAPARPAYGHPGICEPVNQGTCHNQHFRCDCLDTCSNLQ